MKIGAASSQRPHEIPGGRPDTNYDKRCSLGPATNSLVILGTSLGNLTLERGDDEVPCSIPSHLSGEGWHSSNEGSGPRTYMAIPSSVLDRVQGTRARWCQAGDKTGEAMPQAQGPGASPPET